MVDVIYKACRRLFAQNPHVLSGSYIFDWESDVFTLNKTGYCIEVEVKISRSDYLADFKKIAKHHLLINHKKTNVIDRHKECRYLVDYARVVEVHGKTAEQMENYGVHWGYDENGKYQQLNGAACAIDFENPQEKIPNRFYYACPDDLIKPEEVPAYAGLFYVSSRGKIRKIKEAPLLHRNKNITNERLADKYYWRVKNALREIYIYQIESSIKNAELRKIKKPDPDKTIKQILKILE